MMMMHMLFYMCSCLYALVVHIYNDWSSNTTFLSLPSCIFGAYVFTTTEELIVLCVHIWPLNVKPTSDDLQTIHSTSGYQYELIYIHATSGDQR